MTIATLTPRRTVFEIHESGDLVGSVPAANFKEALDDFWDTFLEPSGGYEKQYTGWNFMLCLYNGDSRVFIARAE